MSEEALSYWREDPLFNEHHEHWHIVYPYEGRLDEKAHTKDEKRRIVQGKEEAKFLTWNKRHGELFAYMHSQLLARYAAERISLGLPPVVPLQDYRDPILEGYDQANLKVIDAMGVEWALAVRPTNISLPEKLTIPNFADRPGAVLTKQEMFRDRIRHAIQKNFLPTISDLGERVEATERFLSPYFGALHNDGHLLVSLYENDPKKRGAMFWEATAVRDPVFYRWHAHIDDFFKRFQNALEPYDFRDLPSVKATSLTIVGERGDEKNLTTEMRSRSFRSGGLLHGSEKTEVRTNELNIIDYLSHEDFTIKINITNQLQKPLEITVRIFMAPEECLNDRNSWIEMDKFLETLKPGRNSISRGSRESSVVRHPVLTATMLEGYESLPSELAQTPGCRCGWPYTLFLPRGNPKGMKFRFAAIVTPGDDIHAHHKMDAEHSASYCGLVDSEYPDNRPMGYPFDRPFRTSISEFLSGGTRPPQVISTPVTIKHKTQVAK